MSKDQRNPRLTKATCMEFGLLVVCLLSFFALRPSHHRLPQLAFISALVTLVFPVIWYPFAFCWLKLARILNRCATFLILSFLFLLLVIPIGYIKRIFGKDTLRLRQFKKGQASVMNERNHQFRQQDLWNTF